MPTTPKITSIGNSVGVILPKDLLESALARPQQRFSYSRNAGLCELAAPLE